ncbi:hypothetical protein HMI55_001750 [Coelomomyces lativittatus]|nr:hypothetical protein HMI55_001750 [Coelomomyces lativittatus]
MSECETPLVPEHPDAHAGSTSSFSSRLGDDDEGSHGAHGSSPNNQRKGSQSSTSSSCPQHQITIRIAQNPYGSSPSTDSCSCSCNRK